MKILFTIHDFLPKHKAGSEIYTYNLAKAMSRTNDVLILYAEDDPGTAQYNVEKREYGGVDCLCVTNMHHNTSFRDTYDNPEIDRIFTHILDDFKPDIVHCQHLMNLSTNIVPIAKSRGIPVVLTLHEFWLMCPVAGQRLERGRTICRKVGAVRCAECIMTCEGPLTNPYRTLAMIPDFRSEKADLIAETFGPRVRQRKGPFFPANLQISGDNRKILAAHPITKVSYDVSILDDTTLSFAVGMHPDCYDKPGGGVLFEVLVDRKPVFEQYIDPKRRTEDRKWFDVEIDLSEYSGKRIELALRTSNPNKDYRNCTVGWATPALKGTFRIEEPTTVSVVSQPHRYLAAHARRAYLKTLYALQVMRRTRHIRLALESADLVIAPSPFLRKEFVNWGVDTDKIIFSDYGFDIDLFEGLEKTTSPDVRFGFIGTIAPHKGVHTLVEAFNRISNNSAVLNIYGDPRVFPEYGEFLQLLAKNPNITFRGGFENSAIREVFKDIDVLVVPSLWYENSPLTIHEAFLADSPVIASNLGGMADLVDDMRNGLLFEVGNPDDLAKKISRIVEEPELLQKLREGIEPIKTLEDDVRSFLDDRYRKLIEST
jgi:glycosyltransferase involved in cell wall biosynthesis